MTRHPVSDTERYSIVEDQPNLGVYFFTNFGRVNAHGYRGCGVFSCSPAEKQANIDAIKRGGVRVFDKRSGAEI